MPSRSKSHNHRRKLHHSKNKTSKKYNHTRKNKTRNQSKRNNRHSHSRTTKQRGGFSSCSLATIQEPGLSIPAIGDVAGFNLAETKGAIFRPNCKSDTYQAMTPE
jgi:hypothetical protein